MLEIANQMEQSNYSAEADWATFEEMRAFYNDLYLAATVHDEGMYELVIEYFSWLIQDTESHRIMNVEIEEPKVEEPKVEQPKVEEPKVEQPEVEQPEIEQSEMA